MLENTVQRVGGVEGPAKLPKTQQQGDEVTKRFEKMDGKGIEALELGSKHDLRLLGVMRGSEFLEAGSDLLLATDDRLILLGKKGDLQGFGDAL